MFGALLSGAIGAAGSIFGSISRNEAIQKQIASLNKQKNENQDWYNRHYNEDATQRADAQRVLSLTEESIKRRNRAAAGRAAMMGGTEESVEAEKEANNKALADASSQIAANSEARKDNIEQRYMQRKEKLDDAISGLDASKASGLDILGGAIGGAAKGLAAGANADSLIDKFKKKNEDEELS